MPTTDKRELIIEHVKTALATIRKNAGYYSDLGLKVTEGKSNPFDKDRVDGVDIIDSKDQIVTITEAEEIENHFLEVSIKTIAKSSLTPTTARQHIADVRKAIKSLSDDTWWIQNVRRWTTSGNGFEIEQAGAKVIGTESTFTIEFDTLALEEN